MTALLNKRESYRLARLGSLTHDGQKTTRGYLPTPERQDFLKRLDRLVRAGQLHDALALHRGARDVRIVGRRGSWAARDHHMQGERLRMLLGAIPEPDFIPARRVRKVPEAQLALF